MPRLALRDVSLNLVSVCDSIIDKQTLDKNSNTMEYCNNGKKYRMTTGGQFIRVRGEDKHLIIANNYEQFKDNLSILSSYHILKAQGDILKMYRNLCLAIIFCSREIELNKWYDESSSKVCSLENSQYDPTPMAREALEYITGIDPQLRQEYVKLGAMILTATKINFFQSDHNVSSPMLDGYALKRLVSDACGSEALSSPQVYNALRAFSHWCSIKGIFHCLNIPGLKIDDLLVHNFKSFPEIPYWIKETVKDRYPAGCSSCSIIKKALLLLSQSIYGDLIELPSQLNVDGFLKLCSDIEREPLKYHVRSATLTLSIDPPMELHKIFKNSNAWIDYISCILHAVGDVWFQSNLVVSNKVLTLNKVKNRPLYKQASKIVSKIKSIDVNSMSNESEIIKLLGGPVENSISSSVKGKL